MIAEVPHLAEALYAAALAFLVGWALRTEAQRARASWNAPEPLNTARLIQSLRANGYHGRHPSQPPQEPHQ